MSILRPGATRLPALATALVVLAASTMAASISATADQPATKTTASPRATRPGGLQPLTIPGLHGASYSVTLLTGDQVHLTAASGGRYTATATPNPTTGQAISINARGGPHGVTSMSATPLAAQRLITSGALDRNLFDISWLAAHGDTGPSASIPVTIQYGGNLSAATLRGKAAALAGSTVSGIHTDAGRVDLTVDAARASAFWAALTGQRLDATTQAPHLTGGATQVWPTGHQAAASPQPAAGQRLYQVTETITRRTGDLMACNWYVTTLCDAGDHYLYGVAGEAADAVYLPASFGCVDADPCTTYRVTFNVPAGIYSAGGFGFFEDRKEPRGSQNVELVDPQVTVAGDTSFTIDVDAAQKFSVSTPKPSDAFVAELDNYNSTTDGRWAMDATWSLDPNFWAVPTDPATVGTHHMSTGWVLGKPELTMTLTAPQRLDLNVGYWTYRDAQTAGSQGAVRFTGRQNVQLVDGGYGRTEDFAGLDARGKLVLMRIAPGKAYGFDYYGCGLGTLGIVWNWQLENAIHAGAVGVLIDPTTPSQPPGNYCTLVGNEQLVSFDPVQIANLPFAAIPIGQADQLVGLLAHGAVKIDINGYRGNSPYLYQARLYHEGRIPASLHSTLTDNQLTAVTQHYHSDIPRVLDKIYGEWSLNEWFVGGTDYDAFTAPSDITEYRYVSPSTVDNQTLFPEQPLDLNPVGFYDLQRQAGGAHSEDWFAGPTAPAAQPISDEVLQAQPGKFDYPNPLVACSFCRQGNTFFPVTYLPSGADPKVADGPYVFATDSIHLYHDGQEIDPSSVSGITTYQLPAELARYQLVATTGTTTTSWNFTSARPTTDHLSHGVVCIGSMLGSDSPCTPDPLIFLRYNAHTDLANTVAAPGAHQLEVTAYHQAADAPGVRGLKLWTSTDGGKTWQPAILTGGSNGTYTASYTVPRVSTTDAALTALI